MGEKKRPNFPQGDRLGSQEETELPFLNTRSLVSHLWHDLSHRLLCKECSLIHVESLLHGIPPGRVQALLAKYHNCCLIDFLWTTWKVLTYDILSTTKAVLLFNFCDVLQLKMHLTGESSLKLHSSVEWVDILLSLERGVLFPVILSESVQEKQQPTHRQSSE